MLVAFILLFSITGCSLVESEGSGDKIQVELDQAIDGDTLSVFLDGESENIRLLLIDTPETSHPRLGKQPFGQEAKEFTKNLVEQAEILEIEYDIGQKRDKYDRLLAYVYVDGKMLQEELLKQGLARVAYIFPPNTRYVDQFQAIQKDVQQQGVGIWSVENYAQEDGFHPEFTEAETTTTETSGCKIKGNIGSEKIYHTPESPWYEQTIAEVMFCSEKEANEAGFRAPKQ
jgi:micrococcal nuclease